MSQQQAQYTVEPLATAASESGVNDPQGDAPIVVQEAGRADEEAVRAEGGQQVEQDAPHTAGEQVTADTPQAEPGVVGELQASIAARDSEIAELKAKLAEAEQRAALPPLAGNPAASAAPVEAHGYDLIRKAIESGQMSFGF